MQVFKSVPIKNVAVNVRQYSGERNERIYYQNNQEHPERARSVR